MALTLLHNLFIAINLQNTYTCLHTMQTVLTETYSKPYLVK